MTSLALLLTGLALLDSPAASEPKKVLERAIAAHGGRPALEAARVLLLKGKSRSRFGGNESEGEETHYIEGEKWRREVSIRTRGGTLDVAATWDGTQAWRQVRGRPSEMPAEPAQAETAHRPEAWLLHAADQAAGLRLASLPGGQEPGRVVLELERAGKLERAAFDAASGQLAWIEYDYPQNDGMAEVKIKRRRELWSDWRPLAGGGLLAWLREIYSEGNFERKLTLESAESLDDLEDSLFVLEAIEETPRPADELAD